MEQWQEEGVAAKPDDRFAALASGAALSNTHQLGLSALALQARSAASSRACVSLLSHMSLDMH
jgi:hypothetical protein